MEKVFEQSADAFSRQLPDCLYPGPLMYMGKLDAFVTGNYTARLECYRYQVLVNAQGDAESGRDGMKLSSDVPMRRSSLTTSRGVLMEWYVVQYSAVDID